MASQPSPVVSQPSEPKPESTPSDDEWGEMSDGWGDGSSTLVDQAETYTQQQHEIRRGEGPRDVDGHSLRPLPGTIPVKMDGISTEKENPRIGDMKRPVVGLKNNAHRRLGSLEFEHLRCNP